MIRVICGEIRAKNDDAKRLEILRQGFEIDEKIREIREDFARYHERENVRIFDAEADDSGAILRELLNADLFATRKLFVVKNAFSDASFRDGISANLSRIPEENELILAEIKLDKRLKIVKDLSKKNFVETVKTPTKFDLENAAKDWLKARKIATENAARAELVSRILDDEIPRAHMLRELEKLVNLALARTENRGKITLDDVRKNVDAPAAANAFEILNFAIAHDREKLHAELANLAASGEDPNKFLGLLTSQIFAIAAAKFSHENPKITATKLKINPYQLANSSASARKISENQMREIAKNLAQTDAKIKRATAENGWILIEKFLAKM